MERRDEASTGKSALSCQKVNIILFRLILQTQPCKKKIHPAQLWLKCLQEFWVSRLCRWQWWLKSIFSRAGGFKRALALQECCNGWVGNTKVCNQLCNKSYQYYLKPSKQPMSLMTLGQVGLKKKKGGNSKAQVFSTVSGFILSRGEKINNPLLEGEMVNCAAC